MKADYPGHCDLCDDAIRPGDDIRRAAGGDAADGWVHVDCMTRLEADVEKVLGQLGVKRPRCPSCADLLSGTGVCLNCGWDG